MRHPTERTRRQDGFALLVALLAIVGLTALATGGFLLADTDHRTATNFRAGTAAFQLSESGLDRFLGEASGVPAASTTYDLEQGTAVVTSRLVGTVGDGHRFYRLRARGTLDAPHDAISRTVGTTVLVDPIALDFPGALTTGDTLAYKGMAGDIDGNDAATSSDCPEGGQPTRPGLRTEHFDLTGGGGSSDGPTDGDPPFEEVSDPLSTVDLDWAGILAGDVVDFDYVVSSPSDWPDLAADEWAVIFVDAADYTIENDDFSGNGMVISRGNLTMDGDWNWNGGVMVGGALRSNGTQFIDGAMLTGLNELLGEDVEANDLGNGTVNLRYHSCNLLRAAREAGKMYEVPGTWSERL